MATKSGSGTRATILVVDDTPESLRFLTATLERAGMTVLIAVDGLAALELLEHVTPDLVLMDAVMPGLDGFKTTRQIKADSRFRHLPVIFMTGLTETEHVVAAFQAGGIDYVTKPIRPQEVLARMVVHMQSARQARQARNALDAFGHATMAIHMAQAATVNRAVWQTALARELMQRYFEAPPGQVPQALSDWLREQAPLAGEGREPKPLAVTRGERQLVFSLQQRTSDDDWLIVMREVSDAAAVEAVMQTFRLTLREAEVLYWVAKGKTNRDIGDILGSSPATVKKHLEHVFEKLGVETRNAAASLAIQRVRALAPWHGP